MSDTNILKIKSDRIIIDGHEPTKEQCETMTLLANALEKSGDFKTVEYKDGYAEFEKVGKTEELKFIGAPSRITIIFDSHITKVTSTDLGVEFSGSGDEIVRAASDGTKYIFAVTLKTGYVLDTVTLSDTNADYGTLTDKTDTTFTILAGIGGIMQTITLTSKQTTPSTDIKPIFKRINGSWVKQDAFERVSGAWVRISSKEETTNEFTIQNFVYGVSGIWGNASIKIKFDSPPESEDDYSLSVYGGDLQGQKVTFPLTVTSMYIWGDNADAGYVEFYEKKDSDGSYYGEYETIIDDFTNHIGYSNAYLYNSTPKTSNFFLVCTAYDS